MSSTISYPSADAGDVQHITSLLGKFPDWPIPGILFLDIMPIMLDPVAFEGVVTHLLHHVYTSTLHRTPQKKIDVVVGLDARGFLFGPILASRLGAAFVPVRKPGKLPGKCITATYEKEYGKDEFQMQQGSIKPGQTVLVVDDLIATGGSASAAGELVEKSSGTVAEYLFVIGIDPLKGYEKLNAPSYAIVKA
ncbi:adenine phosphoribosyltransferase [Microbotryomycetes sp. JL221]|nr:adenine phosphoribosyltransferase [Microbotryomycetes sp. JL221]